MMLGVENKNKKRFNYTIQKFGAAQISQFSYVIWKTYNQYSQPFKIQTIMSFFLIPEDQFYPNPKSPTDSRTQNILPSKQKSESFLLGEIFNNQLKSLKQTFLNVKSQTSLDQHYILMIKDLSYKLKALISIKSSRNKKLLSFFVDILAQHETYYMASNIPQTLQICHNIIIQHSYFKNVSLCLKLNPATRQIKLQLPLFLSYSWSIMRKASKASQTIHLIFKTFIKPELGFISSAVKTVLRHEDRLRAHEIIFEQPNKILEKTKTYCQMSNIQSHLACHNPSQSIFSERNYQKRKQSITKFQRKRVSHVPELVKNNKIFAYHHASSFEEPNYSAQTVLQNDQKYLKNKIGISGSLQNKKQEDRFAVFNKIYLKQIKTTQLEKINQGGFADIYITQIAYWHMHLPDGRTPNIKKQNNLINQRLIIKREKPNMELFQRQKCRFQYSRKQHQFKIIHKMKNCKSIYLPKYYFPTNIIQQSNVLANCLLIQYIPYKTLSEVMQKNSKYMTLHSKLCLMFSICQGLRYLRDFNIVHLDLKPNNIITYYNHLVKLIDFGQSYHPQVCINGYKPGFTIPYSAPQIFDDKTFSYHSKSDVFSMGVIFYQLLFNNVPFNFYKSTSGFDEEMKEIQHHWYQSPQEIESYGYSQVLRILIVLISKCLSISQQNRPELDWIAIILNLLLEETS